MSTALYQTFDSAASLLYKRNMSYRWYIASIFVAALFAWGAFLVVINRLSPFSLPHLALPLFYGSLLIALTATLALINYYSRVAFARRGPLKAPLVLSLRQGFLIALITVIALLFQRLRVLTWWNALLLLGVALMIELYFRRPQEP